MPLTSKERVVRALERRDHDRAPRHDSYWGETIRRWEKEGLRGGGEAALRQLGGDLHGLCGIYWPAPFPGRNEKVHEDERTVTTTDFYGQTIRQFKDRETTPEHAGWECGSSEVWHRKFRPLIAEQDIQINIEGIRANLNTGRREEKWCHLCGIEPFEILRKMVGDVTCLMAIAEEPEWIADMSEVTTDNSLRNLQAVLDAGIQPDGLWVFGDMAYNHATMCSPQAYKELIWPSHKRLCGWAHDNGMKFIFHTDGDVNGVVDLYIEAGFDALQPLESKARMDVRQLAPKYGRQLSLFGNIDVMAMITNDMDVIEAEIAAKFPAAMAAKGYLYHSDHSVPPQVSWPTYQAIIKLIEKHGSYT